MTTSSNPFNYKQLKEFTIADCEFYINKYPYGEHVLEVKRLLRELKKSQPKAANRKVDQQTEKSKETKSKTIESSYKSGKAQKGTDSSEDIAKTIFAWIGIIIVVLVVGTIIIVLLNEIIPHSWLNKYKYLIYPIGVVLGWLQRK